MSVDYKAVVKKLKESEPDIKSVSIIEDEEEVVFSTSDWDISEEVKKINGIWDSLHGKSISISEKKFSILQSTPERLVATSIKGDGHILGAKDDERRILVLARLKAQLPPPLNKIHSWQHLQEVEILP